MKKLLAALLVASLLAGYGIAFASDVEYNDYMISDEKQYLTCLVVSGAVADPNDTLIFQLLEELTNVHVDFTVISPSDVKTQMTLMWAGGDYPDMILYSHSNVSNPITIEDISTYGPLGVILPLEDLIDEYMPNLKNVNENIVENAIEVGRLYDGHVYSLPAINPATTRSYAGAYLNTAWLDTLGLEVPTDADSLYEALKAFKTQDPNGNGKADEIPLTFFLNNKNYRQAVFGWFGMTYDWMLRDGEVTFGRTSEDFRTMAKYFNKLWKEDLLDLEIFTQDEATYLAKGKLDETVYGSFVAYRYGTVVGDGNDEFSVMLPIDGGTDIYGAITDCPDWRVDSLRGIITSGCENPEIAAQYLDVLFDPAIGSQVMRGPLGQMTMLNEAGLMVQAPVPEQYGSSGVWLNAVHFSQLPRFTDKEHEAGFSTGNSNIQLAAVTEAYLPLFINENMPYGPFTQEEQEAVNKQEEILEYSNQMFALWVVGERDVDTDWEEYLEQMDKLGAAAVTEAYQSFCTRELSK